MFPLLKRSGPLRRGHDIVAQANAPGLIGGYNKRGNPAARADDPAARAFNNDKRPL